MCVLWRYAYILRGVLFTFHSSFLTPSPPVVWLCIFLFSHLCFGCVLYRSSHLPLYLLCACFHFCPFHFAHRLQLLYIHFLSWYFNFLITSSANIFLYVTFILGNAFSCCVLLYSLSRFPISLSTRSASAWSWTPFLVSFRHGEGQNFFDKCNFIDNGKKLWWCAGRKEKKSMCLVYVLRGEGRLGTFGVATRGLTAHILLFGLWLVVVKNPLPRTQKLGYPHYHNLPSPGFPIYPFGNYPEEDQTWTSRLVARRLNHVGVCRHLIFILNSDRKLWVIFMC